MSRWIRLSDGRGRDARVRMVSRARTAKRPLHAADGRTVAPARLIKAPLGRGYAALRSHCEDDAELARLLIEADPEIDFEAAGRRAGPTDRVLLDGEGNLLYAAETVEVLYGPDGSEIERRPPSDCLANVDGDRPVTWTGKSLSIEEAARRYAFTRQYQVRHVDGLTYDFLFAMAAELDRGKCLVRIGAGPHGRAPLILERNGTPYRGFLEGRIDRDRYQLVLHLTHLELKAPPGGFSG